MITQKEIKSWLPIAEYIFVKHMPFETGETDGDEDSGQNIDLFASLASLPPVYIGSPPKYISCAPILWIRRTFIRLIVMILMIQSWN